MEPGRLRPGIPERMRYPSRLDDIATRSGLNLAVADSRTNLTFEDIGEFVLMGVRMRWHKYPWLDWVFNNRERPSCVITVELEVYSQTAQPDQRSCCRG